MVLLFGEVLSMLPPSPIIRVVTFPFRSVPVTIDVVVTLDELSSEETVVVAERLVIVPISVVSAAVVVAFGAADDVSVLTFPQPVTPSIAAVISREAIVLVISVLFIVESSFFRLDIYLKVVYTYI